VGRPPHGLTAALAAAALTITGCGSGHGAVRRPITTTTAAAAATVRFDRLTGPHHDIPLPQVVAGPAAVNDAIRAALTKVAGDFESDLAGGPGSLSEVSKETTLATSRVVSVKIVLNADTGGAHALPQVETFVADLGGARLLEPADLFPPASSWLAFLSEQARAQLAATEGFVEDTARTGTEPRPENFRHLTLGPDALMVTFDAYQVGPFALGTPTVTVTYASLASAGLAGVIAGQLGRPLK
jgi:hypothetical protein